MNIVCAGDGKNTKGILAAIFLSIVTLGIYAFVWMYGMQNRLRDNASRYNAGLVKGGSSVLMWTIFGPLLLGVGGLVATHIQLDSMNRLAYGYNAAQTHKA